MRLSVLKLEKDRKKILETKTIENKNMRLKYENRNSWNRLFKMQ